MEFLKWDPLSATTVSMRGATFLSLPTELAERVVENLGLSDLCSVRLVSQNMSRYANRPLSCLLKDRLYTLHFFIFKHDLQVLYGLCQIPEVRGRIANLMINVFDDSLLRVEPLLYSNLLSTDWDDNLSRRYKAFTGSNQALRLLSGIFEALHGEKGLQSIRIEPGAPHFATYSWPAAAANDFSFGFKGLQRSLTEALQGDGLDQWRVALDKYLGDGPDH
ncbi:hypothetical protein M011DRAFT_481937 [Sporormia fimetaria CBS 119925]|uniref:F-box domain-containing protein n=1 Tax=Sporormia fimetaria CBS 119925 TaxID=1340428 RepID=A0A6A6UWC6_9PLEO|nr:hypothetical protein M011DRAFT_481937 [Sporormia fimetaria CBS 119925]